MVSPHADYSSWMCRTVSGTYLPLRKAQRHMGLGRIAENLFVRLKAPKRKTFEIFRCAKTVAQVADHLQQGVSGCLMLSKTKKYIPDACIFKESFLVFIPYVREYLSIGCLYAFAPVMNTLSGF